MYKVGNTEFATFDDVVSWAWNTYKIEVWFEDDGAEIRRLQACEELNTLLLSEW